MRIEYLLYGYGAVCVSMIFFNLFHTLALRRMDRRIGRESGALKRKIHLQLA